MLPPLDRDWTWEKWAQAQVAADPGKGPYTWQELAMAVHRGDAADFRPYEMSEMLQVPVGEIRALTKMSVRPDPYAEELRSLLSKLRMQAFLGKMRDKPFVPDGDPEYERFIELRHRTRILLEGITELCDPETAALLRQRMTLQASDEHVVGRYLELLGAPDEGLVPFPVNDAGTSTRDTRAGFRAVSSILEEMGLRWLPDYPPGPGGGRAALRALVVGRLAAAPVLAASLEPEPGAAAMKLPARTKTFVDPPPRTGDRPARNGAASKAGQTWDRSASDALNRALGDAGEEFVLGAERRRLEHEGLADLAAAVRWTAREDGDGAGYDISSFNSDGSVRLIEVKTTNGGIDTPFFVTANEVRVSSLRPSDYWLYRVFDFQKATKAIYQLQGALDGDGLTLVPTVYRARR